MDTDIYQQMWGGIKRRPFLFVVLPLMLLRAFILLPELIEHNRHEGLLFVSEDDRIYSTNILFALDICISAAALYGVYRIANGKMKIIKDRLLNYRRAVAISLLSGLMFSSAGLFVLWSKGVWTLGYIEYLTMPNRTGREWFAVGSVIGLLLSYILDQSKGDDAPLTYPHTSPEAASTPKNKKQKANQDANFKTHDTTQKPKQGGG